MLPAAPSPSTARAPRIAGLVVLVVGALFVAGGVWLFSMAGRLYSTQADLRAHAEHATGTVVEIKETRYEDHKYQRQSIRFAPVFTFTDRGGTLRRATSRVSRSDRPGYLVGDKLSIVYHRDRPDEAEADTFFASWGGVLIAGGIGTAFVAAGGLVAIVGARRLLRPGAFVDGKGSPPTPVDP